MTSRQRGELEKDQDFEDSDQEQARCSPVRNAPSFWQQAPHPLGGAWE